MAFRDFRCHDFEDRIRHTLREAVLFHSVEFFDLRSGRCGASSA